MKKIIKGKVFDMDEGMPRPLGGGMVGITVSLRGNTIYEDCTFKTLVDIGEENISLINCKIRIDSKILSYDEDSAKYVKEAKRKMKDFRYRET